MVPSEERKPSREPVRGPETQNLIDRIFYFEHLCPVEDDSDHASPPHAPRQSTSACFEAWALPDYMRH